MSVGREFMSVYERLSDSGFAGFIGFSGWRVSRCCGRVDTYVVREFMSDYERFRVVWFAVHGICLMGCDRGLADSGSLV